MIEILWDILLEHQSGGCFNRTFVMARKKWFEKWNKQLPVIEGVSLSDEQIEIADTTADIASQMYDNDLWAQSLLNSREYRLGCKLMKPVRRIKKILRCR